MGLKKNYLLIRDVIVTPSMQYPDNSVRKTEQVEATIEWPDKMPDDYGSIVGEWRVGPPIEDVIRGSAMPKSEPDVPF